MDVTTFFTRLLRTSAPDEAEAAGAVHDDYRKFDETWQAIQVRDPSQGACLSDHQAHAQIGHPAPS